MSSVLLILRTCFSIPRLYPSPVAPDDSKTRNVGSRFVYRNNGTEKESLKLRSRIFANEEKVCSRSGTHTRSERVKHQIRHAYIYVHRANRNSNGKVRPVGFDWPCRHVAVANLFSFLRRIRECLTGSDVSIGLCAFSPRDLEIYKRHVCTSVTYIYPKRPDFRNEDLKSREIACCSFLLPPFFPFPSPFLITDTARVRSMVYLSRLSIITIQELF